MHIARGKWFTSYSPWSQPAVCSYQCWTVKLSWRHLVHDPFGLGTVVRDKEEYHVSEARAF